MHLEKGPGRYSKETLRQKLDIVLSELEFDQNLFQDLLCSMPRRFRRVRNANGGETGEIDWLNFASFNKN